MANIQVSSEEESGDSQIAKDKGYISITYLNAVVPEEKGPKFRCSIPT